ncbi:hypothetical protein [Polaribacter aestuariivivens]|uniref:hypothetical protein n=1 Tax=Polaribacter aestuariivivens TaxID=2304626 RepID=UPI003F492C6E
MKPFIYKVLLLIFITGTSIAQTKELVLKESFKVNEKTVLNLDLDNVTVEFKESKGNTIHLYYYIEFKTNSEETKYNVFRGINAKAFKENNNVKIDVKNSMYLGELHTIEVDIESFTELMHAFYKERKKNQFLYKSKGAILKEIEFSSGHSISDYIKKFKKDNPDKKLGNGNKKFEQNFVIYVPKNIKINLKTLHSKVKFNFNIVSPIEINAFKTYFKFKQILTNQNRIIASNGIFQAEKVANARLEFLDMSKVVIGEIVNTEFATETSKIEIGEIKEKVDFKDFNSTISLYNFSDSFSKFNLKGDYSKLYIYNIKKSNYAMDVFGHNTALNMNKTKTTFGISKDKKLDKILEKRIKEDTISDGNIFIELRNGILNIK